MSVHSPSAHTHRATGGLVVDWRPAETAPRDGSWILIEGEMSGGDTSTARVARWNPATFNGLEYEWQTLCADAYGHGDDTVAPADLWNWYCDGRVHGWMPLPDTTSTASQPGTSACASAPSIPGEGEGL